MNYIYSHLHDDKKKSKKDKTVVKKKKVAVTDEDLFGDTDDIFDNVPKDASKPATGKSTKAKTGKGKKKKKALSVKATATEVIATATTGLMYTKYTYSCYSKYLPYCIRFSKSVTCMRFLINSCINSKNCVRFLCLHKKLFNFEIQKCGQILCAHKTHAFSHAGSHI